ncbi:Uncharacterized membrane protein [Saccharopolyspora kobensis]|uniref:Uncharacterized membrane protein n=1 Tax=Saccharopolyspora kobensis TaxID=146035 RepID=A0A1H5VKE5_9PSEU|nr:DUF2231 domain-containing protein [Saccharopolyspora kobensis]SEF87301.1 Uncharacterized membrane protein [Saccharopolyspora kobensis]SFC60250.1 Uncharacterized membrane protein [Saccharopolyspora kobensis]
MERPAEAVARAVRRTISGTRADRLLGGAWLGHPVHPLLVTVPIGACVSAPVLELCTGNRQAARWLIALGLIAVPPAVVAGLADFAHLDARQRRVGALHATANVVSTAFFGASLCCRPGARSAKVSMALGTLTIAIGGALGGHLSYAQGAGVRRWQNTDESDSPVRR